jgi:Flp pilus assembly protein TadG
MMTTSIKRKRREGGHAVVEIALLAPWIFFLFVGVFDMGFYSYAIICTENAARAAAIQTAANPNAQTDPIACNAVWKEMSFLPNVASISPQSCTQLPLKVVRRTVCTQASVAPNSITCEPPVAPLSQATCADCGSDATAASTQVAVTYQSGIFVPIPGIVTNQLTITRIAEMRILYK